jgi:hypothetical protein
MKPAGKGYASDLIDIRKDVEVIQAMFEGKIIYK